MNRDSDAAAAAASWVVDVHDSLNSADHLKEKLVKDGSVDSKWMNDVEQSVESLQLSDEVEHWKKPSIYRVPNFIRDQRKTAFTPQVCSFGPYHHDNPQLMLVEEHKRRALVHFLKRSERPLAHFAAAMATVEEALQNSYSNLDDQWKYDRQGFLKMMILDGCFMLEVIRMRMPEPNKYREIYAENDPVFSQFGVHHRLPYLRRDMLVLENQLPLLVLKMLVMAERICPKPQCPFNKYIAGDSRNAIVSDEEINAMVLNFFQEKLKAQIDGLGLHPLHVFLQSLIYGAPRTTLPKDIHCSSSMGTVRSAVELHDAGIHFRKSDTTCLMNISFSKGVLTLPFLKVHDATEFELLNVIAFEQIHVGAGSRVTAYASFMDQLINTAKDVNLLKEKKILDDALGSEQVIADMINGLAKEVTINPEGYIEDVKKKINDFCENRLNRWTAKLLHTHFQNPFTAIALFAAFLVISLTVVQTLYGLISYYKPHNG